jgi:hypothetical protein
MEPVIETTLHTEEQKVIIKKDEFGTLVLEIIEVADNSSKRLYLTKMEALALSRIISDKAIEL